MKRSLALRLCCVLLCGLLLAGCQSPFDFDFGFNLPFGSAEEEPAADGRRTVAFSEMEYTRPDVDALLAELARLSGEVAAAPDIEAVLALDEEAGELLEVFSSMASLAEVNKYLDTTNTALAEEHRFCSDARPRVSNAVNQFSRAIVEGPHADAYRAEVGDHMYNAVLSALRLNSPEVEALRQQRNALAASYNEDLSGLTVAWEGEEFTLAELNELEEPMYAAILEGIFYETHADHFAGLYTQLIALDREIAATLGFASVAEMYYTSYGRDYTPEEALQICAASRETISPLLGDVLGAGGSMEVSQKDCMRWMPGALAEVDEDLAEAFSSMERYGLANYDADPKKQSGIGFTTYLSAWDAPYSYGYWDGSLRAATTVMHEFGHYYDEWIHWEDEVSQSLDTAEIYSQALELLLHPGFESLTGNAEAAVQSHLGDFAQALTYQAMLEEFQLELYEMEAPGEADISRLYTELLADYGYQDYIFPSDDGLDRSWVGVTHLFDAPFYTISYTTSAVAAMQIWSLSLDDWRAAADTYLNMLRADQNQSFTALLEGAGLASPLSGEAWQGIAQGYREAFGLQESRLQPPKLKDQAA